MRRNFAKGEKICPQTRRRHDILELEKTCSNQTWERHVLTSHGEVMFNQRVRRHV